MIPGSLCSSSSARVDSFGAYNTEACNYDDGDCCEETCTGAFCGGFDCQDPEYGEGWSRHSRCRTFHTLLFEFSAQGRVWSEILQQFQGLEVGSERTGCGVVVAASLSFIWKLVAHLQPMTTGSSTSRTHMLYNNWHSS